MSEVTTSDTNSLTSIIEKYKHHPSITAIKNHMDKTEKSDFSFKNITNDKINYRPIGILLNMSKIYERYIHDEINAYFDDILSIFFCSYESL